MQNRHAMEGFSGKNDTKWGKGRKRKCPAEKDHSRGWQKEKMPCGERPQPGVPRPVCQGIQRWKDPRVRREPGFKSIICTLSHSLRGQFHNSPGFDWPSYPGSIYSHFSCPQPFANRNRPPCAILM